MAAILIVEDDGLIARQMARALRRAGHTPLLAPDARTALEEARNRPELILLDLSLPDLPGEEVLRRLRMQPRTAQIPVMVITGKQKAAARVQESEMNYAELLWKPVSDARLHQAVAAALGPGTVQGTEAGRTEVRRRTLIHHLLAEGSDGLAAQVYRRLCADRLVRGGVLAPEPLSWQEIAKRAMLEGLLDADQAALFLHSLAAKPRRPEDQLACGQHRGTE